MIVTMSSRFGRHLHRNPLLAEMAEQAIRDVVRRARTQAHALTGYDRFSRLKPEPVYEVKISGGNRLLAHWGPGALHLLDLGGHDLLDKYTHAHYATDLQYREPAPPAFDPDFIPALQSRFDDADAAERPFYEEESDGRWSYFLDEQQTRVLLSIEAGQANILLGSPGTGKTSVAFAAVKRAVDQGLDVRISASDAVVDYLEYSTMFDLQRVRSSVWDSAAFLMVDDPQTLAEVRAAMRSWRSGLVGTLVVALDPLQLRERVTDDDLDDLARQGAALHWLIPCYRQKANVGETVAETLEVLGASSHLPEERAKSAEQARNQLLRSRAQPSVFPNPGGYARLYEHPGELAVIVTHEVKRLLEEPDLLWRHWTQVLVVVDDLLPDDVVDDGVYAGLDHRRVRLSDVAMVQGAEYQHAHLFLDPRTYEVLRYGFRGGDEATATARRLLRIPLTRAKDSLVTFVSA